MPVFDCEWEGNSNCPRSLRSLIILACTFGARLLYLTRTSGPTFRRPRLHLRRRLQLTHPKILMFFIRHDRNDLILVPNGANQVCRTSRLSQLRQYLQFIVYPLWRRSDIDPLESYIDWITTFLLFQRVGGMREGF